MRPLTLPRARPVDDHGEMKTDAFTVAAAAVEAHATERDISRHVKEFFDSKYGRTWYCIVGCDFRAFVSHEAKHFIFFYVGKLAICLYRAS